MSNPFLSEIRILSFNYAPVGWAMCNGQFLPINQNQALFSLLGTTYGGNGQTTFQLPDLRGKVPIHMGASFTLGETGGQQAHTITQSEMPTHNHLVVVSKSTGNSTNPRPVAGGNLLAQDPGNAYSGSLASLTTLNTASVGNVGGSQPHQNMQPYTVLTFAIALQGIFPDRN